MTVGALLVPNLPGPDGFGPRELVRLARRAEEIGLARVGVSDHLLHRVGAHDPVALLGAAAGATSRVRLECAVLQLPLRHPVQVAQSFTTLDHLSAGRIELGVGVGGEEPAELLAVGVDPRRRGTRADEALAVLVALWPGEPVTFRGRHFFLDGVSLTMRPVQRPHPPIVVGGRGPAALERAARFATRWDGIFLDPAQYARRADDLDERAAAHCRSVGKGIVAWVSATTRPGEATGRRATMAHVLPAFYGTGWERLERYAIWGTVEDCAARLAELRAAGATDALLVPVGPPDPQLEAIAELAALSAPTDAAPPGGSGVRVAEAVPEAEAEAVPG